MAGLALFHILRHASSPLVGSSRRYWAAHAFAVVDLSRPPSSSFLHPGGVWRRPAAAATRVLLSSRSSSSSTSTDPQQLDDMRAGAIKAELESYGISTKAFLEKSELVAALMKARADGLQPKPTSTTETTATTATDTSNSSSSGPTATEKEQQQQEQETLAPRAERLAQELAACGQLKASELRRELQERGVDTRSLLEKSEFVKALAEARVDGVTKNAGSSASSTEGYAEYNNVEVLTDDASGPRSNKEPQQKPTNPFGGGGANPFSGMGGGMGGMGNIADMFGGMMGGGGAPGANPFAGKANPFGGAGGANPFGGDMMGKAQQLMSNPKVREILQKAQSNPSIMKKVNECMSNPAYLAKYKDDPDLRELVSEIQKYM